MWEKFNVTDVVVIDEEGKILNELTEMNAGNG